MADPIRTSDLLAAKIKIKKGDTRLKKGITLDNMTLSERARFKAHMKQKNK